MIRAAASGAIDFSKAKHFDRNWWFRLKFVIDELETNDRLKYCDMQFNLHSTLLSYKDEKKQFDHHWNRSLELLNRTYNLLFPWNAYSIETNGLQKEYDDLANQWKKVFGDTSDPKVAAEIQKTADIMTGRIKVWDRSNNTHQGRRRSSRA